MQRPRLHVGQGDLPRIGQVSAGWCHLGNLSHRLGESFALTTDADALGDLAGDEAAARMRLHLAQEGLPGDLSVSRGVRLEVEPRSGLCVGTHGPAAEALDAREPREGFALPSLG